MWPEFHCQLALGNFLPAQSRRIYNAYKSDEGRDNLLHARAALDVCKPETLSWAEEVIKVFEAEAPPWEYEWGWEGVQLISLAERPRERAAEAEKVSPLRQTSQKRALNRSKVNQNTRITMNVSQEDKPKTQRARGVDAGVTHQEIESSIRGLQE